MAAIWSRDDELINYVASDWDAMTFMWRHPDAVVKMSYQSFFINYKLSDLLLIIENTLFLNSHATMFANGCTCTRQASSIKRSVLKVCLNITTAAYITSLRTRWQLDLDIIDWIEPGIKPTWTLLLISWLEINWWLGHGVLVTLARIVSRWRDKHSGGGDNCFQTMVW